MTPLQMKQTPKEVKKKSFCLKMKGEHLQLDENHNYFYRVQGQEGVSGIEWFDFALLTDPHLGLNGFFVQRIDLNNNQSESEWLPKLTEFYFNHLLPSSSKITLPHGDYCFYIFQYLLIYKYTWLLLIISLDLTWTLPSQWHLRNLGGGVLCHWYLASTGSPSCYLSARHGNVEPLHKSAMARHG